MTHGIPTPTLRSPPKWLDKALGVDMEVLTKMRNAFDIAQTRKRWDDVEIAAAA
jgi:hypothetical protein